MNVSNIKRKLGLATAGVGSALMAGSAFAQSADLTALTTAVDFSDVQTAILTVAVSLIGVYLIIKGVQFVMKFTKGA